MRIVPELDAGPVAAQESVSIDRLDTAVEVEAKLARACVPLLARALPELDAGRLAFAGQDPAAATYCRRLDKSDGRLDFAAAAPALAARINGLYPWPGCTTELNGETVKLGLADCLSTGACHAWGDKFPPVGSILGADAEGLLVGTGQGVLRLRRLQRPGGKMLPAAEFLRGFSAPPGTMLPSAPMAPLVARTPFPRRVL